MSGISIPISADLDGIKEAFAGLRQDIRALSSAITAAFAPATTAARQAATATNEVGASARRSQATWISWGRSVSEVVASIGNIASAIPHLGKLRRGAQMVGAGLRRMVASPRFQQLRQGAQRATAALRRMVASPNFKRILIGAAAAAVAIGSVVVATRTVSAGLRRLGRFGSGVFRSLRQGAASLRASVAGIFTGGGAMGGALRLAGAAGAVALAVSQIRGAVETSTGFEDLRVQMEQFTGSAEKARALMADLTDFSMNTPFETRSLLQAAATLQSSGIREDVAGIAKDLAAVARDGQQLGELGDALAKGFAKGKFQTEEVNKFLERGINLLPELAVETGKSGAALRDAIEEGLGFGAVTGAIARLSREGGQFFGMLIRRSRTFSGMVSTLKSVWDELRRSFMQPVLDGLKPVLASVIEKFDEMRVKAAEVGAAMRDAFLGAWALIKDGQALGLLQTGFRVAVTGAIDVLMRGLRGAVAFLATALPPVFQLATSKLVDPRFWEGILSLFLGAAQLIRAEFERARPLHDPAIPAAREGMAREHFEKSARLVTAAGNGQSIGQVLASALEDGVKAASLAVGGEGTRGFVEAKKAWRELMRSVGDSVRALRDEYSIPAAPGLRSPGGYDDEEAAAAGSVVPAVSSLGRLGGGGGGFITPMVRAQQRTNQLLEKVVVKMDRPGGGGVALAG